MIALVKQAIDHWSYVAPLLTMPTNDEEYGQLVQRLDEVLAIVGGDGEHSMALLASRMGDLIEAYDEEHRPMPAVTGADALRYLMQEHGLEQADLPGVGAQPVISDILHGKRQINIRQARALSERFALPAAMFLSL